MKAQQRRIASAVKGVELLLELFESNKMQQDMVRKTVDVTKKVRSLARTDKEKRDLDDSIAKQTAMYEKLTQNMMKIQKDLRSKGIGHEDFIDKSDLRQLKSYKTDQQLEADRKRASRHVELHRRRSQLKDEIPYKRELFIKASQKLRQQEANLKNSSMPFEESFVMPLKHEGMRNRMRRMYHGMKDELDDINAQLGQIGGAKPKKKPKKKKPAATTKKPKKKKPAAAAKKPKKKKPAAAANKKPKKKK